MNKTALITGGTRGIGRGIAESLLREGWQVAVCGVRDGREVQPALEAMREGGREVLYCRADVSRAEDRKRMVEEVFDRFGHLNALVNNAGVAPKERQDILEASEESYEWVMKVNLQGPYFLTQLVARRMIEQMKEQPDCDACVVNVSSVSATMASPNRGEYCLSKAGVSMATRLWAVRLAEFEIPVYEVRPGVTKTDMTSGVEEKYDQLIADGLVLQARWGLPEDVGQAVAMLVRGDLPYSTGQVVMVDGGMTVERL